MSTWFTIYGHTCRVSGKTYVGQTSLSLEQRWASQVKRANRPDGCRLLSAAIRKYGPAAFDHRVLDRVATQAGADKAEKLWIERIGCLAPNGYNLNGGGRAYTLRSQETIHRLSESLKASKKQKAGLRRRWDATTPEQRSALSLKIHDAQTPEQRSERQRKAYASYRARTTADERAVKLRQQWFAMPEETQKKILRRLRASQSSISAQARHERALKAAATCRVRSPKAREATRAKMSESAKHRKKSHG